MITTILNACLKLLAKIILGTHYNVNASDLITVVNPDRRIKTKKQTEMIEYIFNIDERLLKSQI